MFKPWATRRLAPVMLATVVAAGAAVVVSGQAASAAPSLKIDNFTVSPSSLAYTGGTIKLAGTVTGATKCIISSPEKITGLPATSTCPGGSPSVELKIGDDTGNGDRYFTFSLEAEAADGATSTEKIPFYQTPAPPFLTSLKASSTELPASGGVVTISITVERGEVCYFYSDPKVTGTPADPSCTSGTASAKLTFPASTSGNPTSYDIEVIPVGLGGKGNIGSTTIFVKGQTPTLSNFKATPATLPDTGGTVTLSATVTYGFHCAFGFHWSGGADPIDKSVLPKTVHCLSGTVSYQVQVNANATQLPDKLFFEMFVITASAKVTAPNEPLVVLAAHPKT